MIESSIRCTTSTVDLVSQSLRGCFVHVVAARNVVHVQEGVSEADIVDRVAVIVEQDVAVEARVKDDVGVLLDVRSILVIVGTIISELYTG